MLCPLLLVLNMIRQTKALGRVKHPLGLRPEMFLALGSVVAVSLAMSRILPANLAGGLFATLFVSVIFIFSSGGGKLIAKMHKPCHYTRGGDKYTPLFKKNND